MARFFGKIFTRSGKSTSRVDSKEIVAAIQGWDLGIEAAVYINDDGLDEVCVRVTRGSNNPSDGQLVYMKGAENPDETLKIGEEIRFVLAKAKIKLETDK